MEHEEVSDANRNLNEELVHVKVELGNVSDSIDDLDRDLANTTADYENVSDRISILSQDLVNVTADYEKATVASSSLRQVLAAAKADFEKVFDEINALRTVLDETVSNIHGSFDEAQRDDDTIEEHQQDIAEAGLEKLLSENLSPTSTKSSESVSSISAENDVQVGSLAKRERLRKERENYVNEPLNVNGVNTRNIMLHPSDDGHVTNAKGNVVHIKNRAQDKSHSGNEDASMTNSIDEIQALTSGLDDRCNDTCVKHKWNTINCHRNTKQTGLFLYCDGNVRTSFSNFCRELHAIGLFLYCDGNVPTSFSNCCRELHAYLAQKGHVQSQRILQTVKFSMSLTVMMVLLLETMKAFATQDRDIIVLVSSVTLGTEFVSNDSLASEAELCRFNRGTTIHSIAIRIQRLRTQAVNAYLNARETTHIGSTKQAVFYILLRQDYLREVERPTPLLSNLDSGMFSLQRAMCNNDVIWNYELQSIKHDSKISHVEGVKIAYEILNHQWTTRHRALTVDSQSHQDVKYDESFLNEVFQVVFIDAHSTYEVMPEEMSASKHASLDVFFVNYGRQVVTLKTIDTHLRKHSASSAILKQNASNAILSDKVVFLYTGNHRTKVLGTTGICHGQHAQVQNIIMPFNCETYASSCQFQDKDLIQGDSVRLGFSNGDHRGTQCTGGSMDFDTFAASSARDDKHYGHAVNETTPLLRANAASTACALRFFKHLGMICAYHRMVVTRTEGYQHGMHCTGGYPDSNTVCSTFLHRNIIFLTSEILTWIENAVDEKTPLLDDRAVLDLQAVCLYKKLGMHWKYFGRDVNESTQQNNLSNENGDGFQLITPKHRAGANNHIFAIPIIQTSMVYVLVEHSDVIRMATADPENNFNIGVCLVQKYQEEDTIFLFEQLKTNEGDGVYVPGAKIHEILFSTASADDHNRTSTLTYEGAQIEICVAGITQMAYSASNTISGETNGALMSHVKCLNSRNDSAETNGAKLKFQMDREIKGNIISVTNFIPMENEITQCVKSGKPIAIRCTGTSDFSRNEDAGKAGIKIIKSVKYEQSRSVEDVHPAITVPRARKDTSHREHKFYTGGYQNMISHETFVELITLIDMNIDDIANGKCKDEVELLTTSLIREASEGNILDAKSDNTTKVILKIRKLRGKRKCHEIPLTTDGIMIDCQYLYMESPRQKALLDQRYRIYKVEIVEKPVIRVTSIIEISIANRSESPKAENESLNDTDFVTCSGEIANGRFFDTVVTTKYGQFTTSESRASSAIKSVIHTNVKAIVVYSTPGNNTDGPFERTNMGDRISAYKSKQGNIKYTERTFWMNHNGINGMKCDDDGNNYPNDSVVCFNQQVLRTITMDTKCDKLICTAALFGKPPNCGKLEYVYGDIEKWRAILQTDITARIRCDIQQQAQGNKTVMKFEEKGEASNGMMDKGGLKKAISDRCPHDTTILCIEDASERTYYKAFENVQPDECKSFQTSPYQAGDKETKPVQELEQYRKKVIITKLMVVMKVVHMVLQSLYYKVSVSRLNVLNLSILNSVS